MTTLRHHTVIAFLGGVTATIVAGVAFQALRADAAPGDIDATFVPITPCRLADTRPAPDRVGPNATLGIDDTRTIQATGTNGDCVIPAGAVGLSLNVTAVGATAPTFLTIWPGGARPTASSLNPFPGQPPTPNAVTTDLSGAGSFDVYNLAGSVNVIVDVNGYLIRSSLQQLGADVAALQALTASMSIETVDGQPTVRFTGVNVQVVDGTNSTRGGPSGRGNLIVGYNENEGDARTGSHNLVVGWHHSYTGSGGLVAGSDNTVGGDHAAVTGGYENTASGDYASVTGGAFNTADGYTSSVTAGWTNTAGGAFSSVTGGEDNTASGHRSVVAGGRQNVAGNSYASVTGGALNAATGMEASVTGGKDNTAAGDSSSVTGGHGSTAGGSFASVTGGRQNATSNSYASVTGGALNTATGLEASVTGGKDNTAAGGSSSVTGGFDNAAGSTFATVTGGEGNYAVGDWSSVTGGRQNTANNTYATVTGGALNAATGLEASVTGGKDNTAAGGSSSVTGGYGSTVNGDYETVVGGDAVPCDDGDPVVFLAKACGEGLIDPVD